MVRIRKRTSRWRNGDHLRVCDRSGQVYHSSEMVREPVTGLVVGADKELTYNPVALPRKPFIERTPIIDASQSDIETIDYEIGTEMKTENTYKDMITEQTGQVMILEDG